MLESGPAAGVIGAQAICAQLGLKDAIAFDMGGTTAKAGVISDSKPLTTGSALIGGYEKALPIQIPMMDIFEVGTGGGSIARVGEGNSLRVGPQSAGSIPGPACYGRGGTEPTVTDANVLLGRLDADNFLGGEMKLDVAAAQTGYAGKTGYATWTRYHSGGRRHSAHRSDGDVIRGQSGDHGAWPRCRQLPDGRLRRGGSACMPRLLLARSALGQVLIPFAPGYFSAYGMLFSDLRYDYVRSCFRKLEEVSFEEIEGLYSSMEEEGRAAIAMSAIRPEAVVIERAADMRYVGQEHAVTVELPGQFFADKDRDAIKRRFDEVHAIRYGTSAPKEPADLVSLRTTVLGTMRKPPRHTVDEGQAEPLKERVADDTRMCTFAVKDLCSTPVFKRASSAQRQSREWTGIDRGTCLNHRGSTRVTS